MPHRVRFSLIHILHMYHAVLHCRYMVVPCIAGALSSRMAWDNPQPVSPSNPHSPNDLEHRTRLAPQAAAGYNALVKLDRQTITKSALHNHADDNYVPGTIEERVLMVWPITREVAALNPQHDVERRLQRDVVRVVRRER